MLVEGIKINLGGREFVAPPLPLKVFRLHPDWFETLNDLTGLPTPETVEIMTQIILSSLHRNYPDLTAEELEDLLDVNNMPIAMRAVMGQATGEAVSPSANLTGATFMGS